jgi:hypothetical protein
MSDYIYDTINLPSLGYLIVKLSENLVKPIKDEIEEIKNNFDKSTFAAPSLAGNIHREYELIKTKEYLHDVVSPLCNVYKETYPHYFSEFDILTKSQKNIPIELAYSWVNFQKAGEFNPSHKHSGLFSFVLYIDIPYSIEDEFAKDLAIHSNSPRAGCFEFQFVDACGNMTTKALPTDKKFKNTLIFFPAKLSHAVYPFYTSNDYRISVSGNFKYRV